jgi:hypothetical protein
MRRVGVALVAALAACSNDDPFATLPKPDKVDVVSTTTTTEPDLTGVPLAPVAGVTTTTAAIGPGPLTIVGRVEGPEGVVAGAIVQLERIVGEGVASARVPTAADGTWNLSGVLGGRYRIRAWRQPDLVTAEPEIVFLESGPQRAVSLRVEVVGGVRVDAAIAPDPPIVDEPANLKVRVAERTVDDGGIVRDTPVGGVQVQLVGTGDWRLESSTFAVTGSDGGATFRVVCEDDGEQPLYAELEDGQQYALMLPPCLDPEATTTSSTSTTSSSTSTTEG